MFGFTSLGYQTKSLKGYILTSIIERMKSDKKSIGQQIKMVLLKEIGTPYLYECTEEDILLELEHFHSYSIIINFYR